MASPFSLPEIKHNALEDPYVTQTGYCHKEERSVSAQEAWAQNVPIDGREGIEDEEVT